MPSLLGGTDLHHGGQSKVMPALLEMFANSETVETLCTEDFPELKILSRILWYIGQVSDCLGLLARHGNNIGKAVRSNLSEALPDAGLGVDDEDRRAFGLVVVWHCTQSGVYVWLTLLSSVPGTEGSVTREPAQHGTY
jgi:hypothetical protein